MGTSGPGNVIHIDNLYPKTHDVKADELINLGTIAIYDDTSDAVITLNDDGVVSEGAVLNAQTNRPSQAGEDANNLTTTDALLRKSQIEVLTRGGDWEGRMEAGILPGDTVGIKRVDAALGGFRFTATNTVTQIVGIYKGKSFSSVSKKSVLDDNGIVSTGLT